jgi:uncharacterized protein YaaN involved in tellurite resistance
LIRVLCVLMLCLFMSQAVMAGNTSTLEPGKRKLLAIMNEDGERALSSSPDKFTQNEMFGRVEDSVSRWFSSHGDIARYIQEIFEKFKNKTANIDDIVAQISKS